MKKYRLQIVLLLLAGLLGTLVLREYTADSTKREDFGLLPAGLAPDDLSRITIKNVKGEFTLAPASQGKDANWHVNGEAELRVTGRFVLRLIDLLVKAGDNARPVAEDPGGAGSADAYGLQAPAATFALVFRDGRRWFLRLGGLNSYTGGRYVRAGTNPVMSTPDTMDLFTGVGPEDLVTRVPFNYELEQVSGVEFKSSSSPSVFTRLGSESWKFEAVETAPVATGMLRRFLKTVLKPPVQRALIDKENISKLHKLPGSLQVEILINAVGAQRRVGFSLFKYHSNGALYLILLPAGHASLAYVLQPDQMFLSIFDPERTFIDRKVFDFPPEAISSVAINKTDSKNLMLTRAGKQWRVNEQPGDAPFVQEYLRVLCGLQCYSVGTLDDDRMDSIATLSVQLSPQGGSKVQILRGKADQQTVYALSSPDLTFRCNLSGRQVRKLVPAEEVFLPAVEAKS